VTNRDIKIVTSQ